MKQDLQEQIIKKYPILYQETKLSVKDSCMGWGIATGDGWFDLINETSAKIVKEDPKAVMKQIKEKFGMLRIYIQTTEKEVFIITHEAEEKSATVCENCGKPAKLNMSDCWWNTLCKECKKKK